MDERDFLKNLAGIYKMLEDDLSKELYRDRFNWLVTGDYKYIAQIVSKSHPKVPVWNRKKEAEYVKLLPQNKKIVFYGTGAFAERIVPYIKNTGLKVEFCDSSTEKQNQGFYDYPVISPNVLFDMKENKAIVICTTKYMEEVKNSLLNNGIKPEEILDIRAYFQCGTGDEYFYEDFLNYSEKEIFIDAGCCDLGTTVDFTKVCKGNLKKVYAFEPDVANYEKCMQKIAKEKNWLPEIKMFPYGTWSSEQELQFEATADGCSHVGVGNSVIRTVAIDDIVDENDRITFIKMDVEGSELESLKGAQKTIKKNKPKLAICIYHKPEDILTLPLYIQSLVPEYRYYLRSYSNADNEMVLYAI